MRLVELRLPADSQYVSLARLVVSTAARQAGMTDERISDLKIAVSEAVTSALLAGAGSEAVILTFGASDRTFEFSVASGSPGNTDAAAGMLEGDELPGLGVTLIQGLTDEARVVHDGQRTVTRVRMAVAAPVGWEDPPAPVAGGSTSEFASPAAEAG